MYAYFFSLASDNSTLIPYYVPSSSSEKKERQIPFIQDDVWIPVMFVMCVRASLTSGRTGEHEASNLQVIRVATEYTFQLSPSSHLVKTNFERCSRTSLTLAIQGLLYSSGLIILPCYHRKPPQAKARTMTRGNVMPVR